MTANKLQSSNRDDMITVSTLTSWMFRMAADSLEIAQFGRLINNEQQTIPHYDLIVVDESFAANAIALLDVALFALETLTPVILIGDPNQLPAIQNPPQRLFNLLRQANILFDSKQLEIIQRTGSNDIIHFSRAILNNDPNEYKKHYSLPRTTLLPVALLSQDDFLNEDEVEEYLAQRFVEISNNHGLDSILLVPTNEMRRVLAEKIQIKYQLLFPTSQKLRLSADKKITLHTGEIVMVMNLLNWSMIGQLVAQVKILFTCEVQLELKLLTCFLMMKMVNL
nr:AAA family ATPase [Weissella oryzae]